MNAIDYTTLSKKELHQHAKAAGIKYGRLSLLQIREQLAKADTKVLAGPRKPVKKANKGASTKTEKKVRAKREGTKMEKAIAIVKANPNKARKDIIKLFISDAKLTKAGSATYYSLVMKALKK